jgi:hypothetical protein
MQQRRAREGGIKRPGSSIVVRGEAMERSAFCSQRSVWRSLGRGGDWTGRHEMPHVVQREVKMTLMEISRSRINLETHIRANASSGLAHVSTRRTTEYRGQK